MDKIPKDIARFLKVIRRAKFDGIDPERTFTMRAPDGRQVSITGKEMVELREAIVAWETARKENNRVGMAAALLVILGR